MNNILKQLIESRISDYLEESYEDDLMESIMEEVSEETWEAIEEAILNELSPEFLDKYMSKTHSSVRDMKKKSRAHKTLGNDAEAERLKKKAKNREDGFTKALTRQDAITGGLKKRSDGVLTHRDGTALNKGSAVEKQSKKMPASYWEKNSKADLENMPADEFEKKYKMKKAAFKDKYHYFDYNKK